MPFGETFTRPSAAAVPMKYTRCLEMKSFSAGVMDESCFAIRTPFKSTVQDGKLE
jgi:hypothetical protein